MNICNRHIRQLTAVAVSAVLLAACSTSMPRQPAAENARSKLTQLQADPQLASRAPVAMKDAELAVRAAEEARKDPELAKHLALMADRKIEIARAQAQTRLYEDQRVMLADQREKARLDARTSEADRAHSEADSARAATDRARSETNLALTEAARQRSLADAAGQQTEFARQQTEAAKQQTEEARQQTDVAQKQTDLAQLQAGELQKQLTDLNAKSTDRGFVVTLGDVLFDTGKSSVKGGAASNLSKLSAFLNQYRDRTVTIEGHTDDVGSEAANVDLSQRRADSVKAYLVGQGISTSRLAVFGKGETSPVASNDSATGRQQNRRVEVIISNTNVSQR